MRFSARWRSTPTMCARYNLVCVYAYRNESAAALATIAEGLSIDEAARIATVSSKSRPKCWDSSPSATSRRGISCSTACGSWEARKEATSQDLEVRSQELELRSLKLAGEVPATGSYPCRITAIQMV